MKLSDTILIFCRITTFKFYFLVKIILFEGIRFSKKVVIWSMDYDIVLQAPAEYRHGDWSFAISALAFSRVKPALS